MDEQATQIRKAELTRQLMQVEAEIRRQCKALADELIAYLSIQASNLSLIICSLTPEPPFPFSDYLETHYRAYLDNHENIVKQFNIILSAFPASESVVIVNKP